MSAVSGGSIVAALLASNLRPWPTEKVDTDEWEAKVVGPFRRLTQRDIPDAATVGPFAAMESLSVVASG